MNLQAKRSDIEYFIPRPVRPRALRHHVLFGENFVKNHMFIDDAYTPEDIIDQFEAVTNVLTKRQHFQELEKKAKRKVLQHQFEKLRQQYIKGREQLKAILSDKQELNFIFQGKIATHFMCNEMQPNLVRQAIDQKTFSMRKERDRLQFRLTSLKKTYEKRLLYLSNLENRKKYEKDFLHTKEDRLFNLNKQIQTANTRLMTVKAINDTYTKIVKTLKNDETFHEPILKSLDQDLKDQQDFIKHIIYLGAPGLKRFRELSEKFDKIREQAKESLRLSLADCTSLKLQQTTAKSPKPRKPIKTQRTMSLATSSQIALALARSYVRDSENMMKLQQELIELEDSLKEINSQFLCTNVKDVKLKFKNQLKDNTELHTKIELHNLQQDNLEFKQKYSKVVQDLLLYNLDPKEYYNMRKIEQLKKAIKEEDKFQEMTLANMKNKSDTFVLLRCSLWNMHEIMHYVGPTKIPKNRYPNKNLALPLLSFGQSITRPPLSFEENLTNLLNDVTNKLKLLLEYMDAAKGKTSTKDIDSYCNEMIAFSQADDNSDSFTLEKKKKKRQSSSGLIVFSKYLRQIPDREHIKMESEKLVREKQMLKF